MQTISTLTPKANRALKQSLGLEVLTNVRGNRAHEVQFRERRAKQIWRRQLTVVPFEGECVVKGDVQSDAKRHGAVWAQVVAAKHPRSVASLALPPTTQRWHSLSFVSGTRAGSRLAKQKLVLRGPHCAVFPRRTRRVVPWVPTAPALKRRAREERRMELGEETGWERHRGPGERGSRRGDTFVRGEPGEREGKRGRGRKREGERGRQKRREGGGKRMEVRGEERARRGKKRGAAGEENRGQMERERGGRPGRGRESRPPPADKGCWGSNGTQLQPCQSVHSVARGARCRLAQQPRMVMPEVRSHKAHPTRHNAPVVAAKDQGRAIANTRSSSSRIRRRPLSLRAFPDPCAGPTP